MIQVILYALLQIVLLAFAISFLAGILSGAGYLPTRRKTAAKMFQLANIRPGERVVDLGSGDGRIVIALARAGLEAHGYEINPFLVLWSKAMIRFAGLRDKAHIHWKSYWDADLAPFDVVIVFGMFHIMDELREKLEKELRPGSRVVANFFEFPVWRATAQEGRVYLYTLPVKESE